jgi:hypothetical protein
MPGISIQRVGSNLVQVNTTLFASFQFKEKLKFCVSGDSDDVDGKCNVKDEH